MATTLLLHLPSFNNCRMSQEVLRTHSLCLQKGITCLSISPIKLKCKIKLYILSHRAIPRRYILRPFASVGSLEVDVARQGKHVSSDVSSPNDFERSNISPDRSSKAVDSINNFEGQLQELFNEVKTMVMMGNTNDAVDLLQANYEIVKEQINAGAKGMEEAGMLDIIALGYMAIGDFKFVGYLLDMLNEIVDNLKDDEPLLDSILIHMGSMYSTLGKSDKSMLVHQRVIDILKRTYGEKSTFLVTPLLGMAKVLGSVGRTTKAVDIYQHAITILELSRGAESEDLVVPLSGLGNFLIKYGKASDAETPFTRILNIYTKLYGKDDGRVGMAMCSLAQVKCAKGNAEEAIHLYKNALRIIKSSNYMDLDDNMMEKMRIDLAELLHVVGRAKEGRELLEECLMVTEKYKGKEHQSSVTHLLNLATSYSRSKNFVEAERLLRTCLDIMIKSTGPNDQAITFPMLHLAVILFNLKQDEEAEQLALNVLRIRENAFGKDSLPVGEALDCLVSIQTRLEKDENKLLNMLKRVLKIQEKELGEESEQVVITLKKIVFYLDKLGRKDEKFSIQKRLSLLRKKYKEMVRY